VFESWAHQLTPFQFETFAKPYADIVMNTLRERHPDVPVIFFANGGSGYLESQCDMACDMLSLDQFVDMREFLLCARSISRLPLQQCLKRSPTHSLPLLCY
jgi:uroporphyrinogen decarboxylase